jgi:hypothetical protein
LIAGASKAVMSKIMAHDGAAAALATTMAQAAEQAGRQENPTTFRPGAGIPTAEPAT